VRKLVHLIETLKQHPELCLGVDLGHPLRETTGIAAICLRCFRTLTFTTFPTCVLSLCTYLRNSIIVVAIDAPLSFPRKGIERELEKLCRRQGYRLIPPMLGGMRRLTETGICLREILDKLGIRNIEIHPRSSLKALSVDLKELLTLLNARPRTRHEQDAVLAAVTGLAYVLDMYVEIRDSDGNSLILPKPEIVNYICQRKETS